MTSPSDPQRQGQPGQQPPPGYGQQPSYGPPQQGGYPPPGQQPPPAYGQPPPPGYGQQQGHQPQGYPPPGSAPAGRSVTSQFTPDAIRAAYTSARPPKPVHQAFLALVAFLALGLLLSLVSIVFNSGLLGVGAGVVFLIISLILYAVVLFICIQMRAGRQWARITMAVLAGLGLLSGVVSFFSSLAVLGLAAGLLGSYVSPVYTILSLVIGIAQIALLVIALVLMFRPTVKSYFS